MEKKKCKGAELNSIVVKDDLVNMQTASTIIFRGCVIHKEYAI